jgi:hypothetical protein
MAKLGEGERQVRLGQDRLAIKRKRADMLFYPHPRHMTVLNDNHHE